MNHEALFYRAVRDIKRMYPTELFPEGNENSARIGASMARRTCDNIIDMYERLKEEERDKEPKRSRNDGHPF